MIRLLIFRFRRRRAISTMIGGVIILTLVLTALVTMVLVSQQNDQYQQSADEMVEYDRQRSSESLVSNSPGLTFLTSDTVSGWGSGCTSTYNCYNMSLSNLGGVSVQIVRIYINSTGSGCTTLCVLNPAPQIASYTFNRANSFVNSGEVNHQLVLALPRGVSLPNPPLPGWNSPENTIFVASARGNVFSFQWPLPILTFGQSGAAFSSGLLKVAYQAIGSGGYDSIHDYKNATGHTSGTYCHNEALKSYPAPYNSAEKLTGITGVQGSTLYFVNPWVTEQILGSTCTSSCYGSNSGTTQMYLYAVVFNTFKTAYTVSSGTIDLSFYSSDHIDGVLYGLYYQGSFYPVGSLPNIQPSTAFYAIFKINQVQLQFVPGNPNWPGSSPITSFMFWGGASLSTMYTNQTYFSGSILASGFWVRYQC